MSGFPSGGRQQPTLEEVAARAGVSRATASRVLRGATNVSEQARLAVEKAAGEIAYAPNRAARALVTGRSDSVAFLVAETEDRLFTDPFFLGMLRGAQSVIAEAGLQLVFTVAATDDEHNRFIHYAAGGHVDGVLVLSLHGRDQLPQRLETPPGADGAQWTSADRAERAVLRRLRQHRRRGDGDRAPAGLGPAPGSPPSPARRTCAPARTGWPATGDALDQAGRPVEKTLVEHGTFSIASGYAAMLKLLADEPAVDAVFAASDLTAIGAMRAIVASGRRVYDDVAVVGFDDIGDAQLAHPALTTVRQPINDMGRTMAGRLLQRIGGVDAPLQTVLPVELIKRETRLTTGSLRRRSRCKRFSHRCAPQ